MNSNYISILSLSNNLSDNSESDMVRLLGNNTSGFYIKNLHYLIIKKLFPYAALFFIIMSYLPANVLYNLTSKKFLFFSF